MEILVVVDMQNDFVDGALGTKMCIRDSFCSSGICHGRWIR